MGPYNTEMGVSKSEKERYDKESRAQGYGKGEGKRIRRFMLLSLKMGEQDVSQGMWVVSRNW